MRKGAELQDLHTSSVDSFAEATSFLPELGARTRRGVPRPVAWAKRQLRIPVIASLNGLSTGSWVHWAEQLAANGADALELNVYVVAADLADTAATVEHRVVDLVRAVRSAISIPLAVKLSLFFSAVGDVAQSICGAGADGLVLFNRFSQPDLDLDAMTVVPGLELSTPSEVRLPLMGGAPPRTSAVQPGAVRRGGRSADREGDRRRRRRGDVDFRPAPPWPRARDGYWSTDWPPGSTIASTSRSTSSAGERANGRCPIPTGTSAATTSVPLRTASQKYVPSSIHSAR
ncbi:MAG: hypothetical protein R2705_00635 [Ilumatobacteraceae bacterium]